MTIAILSDLHAFSNKAGGERVSFLDPANLSNDPRQNPVVGLKEMIKTSQIKADLLLCGGDIVHKADVTSFGFAWQKVAEIGEALGVSEVFGTVGNHDMDSRFASSTYDPSQMVKNASADFPTKHILLNDLYWSRGYCIFKNGDIRIVIINSCSFHGYESEYKHGRVTEDVLASIRANLESDLSSGQAYLYNIVLCHHHPAAVPQMGLPDYDAMIGGPDLIELIGDGKYGQWILVHGHKHKPQVSYAPGSSASPVIFSAGSLSAVPYPELVGRARNQFYVIDLTPKNGDPGAFYGSGSAWDWGFGVGWEPAGPKSGIPRSFGFGHRPDFAALANQIAYLANPLGIWSAVLASVPEVGYIIPADFSIMQNRLLSLHGKKIYSDSDGIPMQIGDCIY